jgi:hypothetical protein
MRVSKSWFLPGLLFAVSLSHAARAEMDETDLIHDQKIDTTLLKEAPAKGLTVEVKKGTDLFVRKVGMSCLSTPESQIYEADLTHIQIYEKNPQCAREIEKLAREWDHLEAPVTTLRAVNLRSREFSKQMLQKVKPQLEAKTTAKISHDCPCVIFRGEGAEKAVDIARQK